MFISCVDDGTGGRVQLRNEGSTKLSTTSTGIDVTGTVVSDGLGIGVSSPAVPLDIKRLSNATIRLNYGEVTTNNGEDYYGGVEFFADGTVYGRPTVSANMRAIHTRAGTGHSNSDAGLIFGTGTSSSNAAATERMRIQANSGYVGINTTAPSTQLEVNGGTLNRIASFVSTDGTSLIEFADNATTNRPAIGAEGNDLAFFTNGEKARIDSSGYLRLQTGGIQFNGDTATANALDDYEEGTWTPVLSDATTGGNTSPTTATSATYTKVGRLVTVQCSFIDVNKSGMTAGNDLIIQGFPFTATSVTGTTYMPGSVVMTNTTFAGSLNSSIVDNNTYGRFNSVASGGSLDHVMVSEISSGTTDIYLSLTYSAA